MKKRLCVRLIFSVVTIVLTACLGIVMASAEEVSGKCGPNITWTLNTETGVLRLEGSGNMTGYSQYENPTWSPYWDKIKEVKISDGITNVGYWVFYGCRNLERAEIPESVTQIRFCAFSGCSSLKSVNIPSRVTVIEQSSFYGCSSLESIVIPDGVTTIKSSAFASCRSLRSIRIPDSVTSIEVHAFTGCGSLESVQLSNNLATIGKYVFQGCGSLTEIKLPDSLESMEDNAFAYCNGLTEIFIPVNLRYIGKGAFSGCQNLRKIRFENQFGWLMTEGDGTAYYDVWNPSLTAKKLRDNSKGSLECPMARYQILFMNGEEVISQQTYSTSAPGLEIPAVPARKGCVGVWVFDRAEEYTVYIKPLYASKSAEISGASLVIGESLTLKYYAKGSMDAKMKFTFMGKETTVEGVYDATQDEHVFALQDIDPGYLGENIQAELILISEDGSENLLDVKAFYSVREYCEDLWATHSDNKTLTTLLADLLAYGAACQNARDYNKDQPADDGFDGTPSEWKDVAHTDQAVSDKTREDVYFVDAGVRFGNTVQVFFRCCTSDRPDVTVTIGDKVYTPVNFEYVPNTDEVFAVYTEAIYLHEFDRVFTAKLEVNGEVVQTFAFSARSYVYNHQNGTDNELSRLVKAAYNYGQSIIAYRRTQ